MADDFHTSSFNGPFDGPFDPGDPRRAPENGINIQNGKVEPQNVSPAYDYYFMPAETKHKHRHHKSKHHHHHSSSESEPRQRRQRERRERGRFPLWGKIVLGVIALFIIGVAIFSLLFWRSAQTVSAQASAAVAQATEIKANFKDGDFTAMSASVKRMSDAANNMRAEVNGPMWGIASAVPILSGDIEKVRALADIFCDLVDNGAIPLIDSLEDRNLSDVLGTGGAINLPLLNDFIGGLQGAAVVIDRDLTAVNEIEPAGNAMVNDRMEQARTQMSSLDGLLDRTLELLIPLPAMLGDGGITRRYIINAIQPADERAGGGTAGSTGVLEITDGQIKLSNFTTYKPHDVGEDQLPQVLPEELYVLGEGVRSNPGNSLMTPDYPRSANIFMQAWVRDNGLPVNGVIAVDPVFLQWCLRYVGGVNTSYSWEVYKWDEKEEVEEFDHKEFVSYAVDGKNASEVLSHTIYMQVPDLQPEEDIFSDIAHKSLDQFMNNLDKVGFSDFIDLMRRAGDERHLRIWMTDEDEEYTIRQMGMSGVLQHVTTETPELGVYVNDYSWGQMGWYLDLRTSIDAGTANPDGSTTYQATTTVHNVMTIEEMHAGTSFVFGVNSLRRNDGDMCTELMLFAPAGGHIDNVMLESTYKVWDPYWARMYDLDLWSMRFWTNMGETSTITYTVTTAPEATGKLKVRQTPTCRTF